MEIIALILSGLAPLAAITCLGMIARNEKRSKKRNTALVNYVDTKCTAVSTAAIGRFEQLDEDIVESEKRCIERITKLENGIIPDYEQAKAAANAVNDFSKGISNILGFDPMEALKAERAKKEAGDPD